MSPKKLTTLWTRYFHLIHPIKLCVQEKAQDISDLHAWDSPLLRYSREEGADEAWGYRAAPRESATSPGTWTEHFILQMLSFSFASSQADSRGRRGLRATPKHLLSIS